eukprot:CAMPEP_0194267948 /NCGR_PEP_ID=MMETSP0169-20130528/2355_1 /TAXON_ID=218684 /ORGANISM="Corethron pennatum, Strain L29A3" /LENGTH=438 /DNA_ID=CAMNT_0039008981 /DNA_START=132 /DNA_END=1448 /DNA_ORIENTATION=-
MGAALLTCPAMCAGQLCACCAASTCSSLCGACCDCDGVDRTGRKRSVFLLVLSLASALGLQYGAAPRLAAADNIVTFSPYLADVLQGDCLTNDVYQGFEEQCIGNMMVYRASFCSTVFFLISAAASLCAPGLNRKAWPAKYSMFFLMLAVSFFISTKVFDENGYLIVARLGGAVFMIFQLIILIDVAYNWNDTWVANADEDDLQEFGSGKKWLVAIVASAVGLYIGSLVAIGCFYHYFKGEGCHGNITFITITLIGPIIFTVMQMSGEEGSLLTSGVITAYCVYLCYSSLIKNPVGECNPVLGSNDVFGQVVGMTFTIVSLAWTGFSYTAESKIGDGATGENLTAEERAEEGGDDEADHEDVDSDSFSWKLNLVLALISMYYAVLLTGWGQISDGKNAANPDVGNVSYWLIIASQWLIMLLFMWTLMAPKLFPDRDFS